jgi:hypothetical protein
MTDGTTDFETLLRQAFAPVDPPADLADRVEVRLTRISELARDELESWELEALRDPRNWTRLARPVAAGVIAGGAGAALIVLRARREAKPTGLRKLLPKR